MKIHGIPYGEMTSDEYAAIIRELKPADNRVRNNRRDDLLSEREYAAIQKENQKDFFDSFCEEDW